MKSNPLRSNRDAPSRFLKNLKKIWTSRPDLTPRYDKASNKIVRGQIGTVRPVGGTARPVLTAASWICERDSLSSFDPKRTKNP